MNFFRLWLTGYLHPGRAFEALAAKPAPHYGLYGVLMRGLIMGLVWYLPRAVMGLRPSMAPALPFPPVETYYWHTLWYFPVFELVKWLLMAAIMHLEDAGVPNLFGEFSKRIFIVQSSTARTRAGFSTSILRNSSSETPRRFSSGTMSASRWL
jgi:hypothetical protein